MRDADDFVFAEAADVERFVDWIVGDAFGSEIAFVEAFATVV